MPDSPVAPEIDVVESFIRALERQDVAAMLDLVDPEIVYQNVPLPPARGRAAFERQMRMFERYVTGFEAHVHAIAANGPMVLSERTDVMRLGPVRAEFWVCGSFEVRDGKVALWRDYFDYVDVTVAVLKGVFRALLDVLRGDGRHGDDVETAGTPSRR